MWETWKAFIAKLGQLVLQMLTTFDRQVANGSCSNISPHVMEDREEIIDAESLFAGLVLSDDMVSNEG